MENRIMKKILKEEKGSIMFPVGVMVFLILIFMFLFHWFKKMLYVCKKNRVLKITNNF